MKQEDTKQKILDKALALFSSRGYDAVSVGEIAQAVGIKAPSLYNHFPSKQAIFDALVDVRRRAVHTRHRSNLHPRPERTAGYPRFHCDHRRRAFRQRPGRFSSIRSTTRPSAASAA